MLAHPIIKKSRNSKGVRTEKKRDVLYPAHVQRKLNGLRCLAIIELDGSVTLKSRQGTVWDTLGHIEAAVAELGQPGDIFDGEVYIHGLPLQSHNSLIKNGTDPEVAQARLALQFHIYDMPARGGSKNGTWMERYDELRAAFQRWTGSEDLTWYYDGQYSSEFSALAAKTLVLVGTYSVNSEEEVKNFAGVAMAAGYEGVIIRQTNMGYTFGKRKDALIKWKDFMVEEFIITDIHSREYFDTTSSFDILDKCICQNNLDEQTFEVVPLGTIPEKQKMWENREDLIGKRLMVRYLERSIKGIPQGNPVGIAFRLDEDMPLEEAEMWD
jgi:ATP-dependent DNA ligase